MAKNKTPFEQAMSDDHAPDDTETDDLPLEGSDGGEPGGALKAALAVAVVIALGLAATLGIVLAKGRGGANSSPTATATVTTTHTTTVTVTATAGTSPTATTPPEAPVFLEHFIPVNASKAKPGAIIVEIHTDYQCPWCQRAEEIYGQALYDASLAGDVELRIHLRTMVGDRIIKNDSSVRAAVAAVCAHENDRFWAYHSTVFVNQPHEGVGFTDDQLRNQFAAQAGITGNTLTRFQTCYDTKATRDAVATMEDEAYALGINGTPAFYVNGIKVNFNLQIDPISAADLVSGLKELLAQP